MTHDLDRNNMARNMRWLRKEYLGCSQEELADRIKVGRAVISRIETAKGEDPSLISCLRIVRFFNLPLITFLERDVEEYMKQARRS